MPNYFKQQNENDAEHELSQFARMIQSNCSSVLQVFLCSLYFPPCADNTGPATPPCRSVCRKAKRDCEPWIQRHGFKWPYKFECSSFSDPSDRACVGKDGTVNQSEYRKILIISPGLIFVPKAFFLGLFSEGLIIGGNFVF